MSAHQTGQCLEIKSVDETNIHSPHLIRLGFLPGKKIHFRSRAPLGDPYIVALDDSCYMLRHEELAALELIPIPIPIGDVT